MQLAIAWIFLQSKQQAQRDPILTGTETGRETSHPLLQSQSRLGPLIDICIGGKIPLGPKGTFHLMKIGGVRPLTKMGAKVAFGQCQPPHCLAPPTHPPDKQHGLHNALPTGLPVLEREKGHFHTNMLKC